jgi:hypothetical protein
MLELQFPGLVASSPEFVFYLQIGRNISYLFLSSNTSQRKSFRHPHTIRSLLFLEEVIVITFLVNLSLDTYGRVGNSFSFLYALIVVVVGILACL